MNLSEKPNKKRTAVVGISLVGVLLLVIATYAAYTRQAYQRGTARNRDTEIVSFTSNYLQLYTTGTSGNAYVAKNIVAAGLADKCEIQLSYAIGVAKPTSINVNTFGTGKVSDGKLVEMIRENFDLRPAGIIKMLDLRRPIYAQTAAYGHFGRTDIDLPWEKTDKAEVLKKYLA